MNWVILYTVGVIFTSQTAVESVLNAISLVEGIYIICSFACTHSPILRNDINGSRVHSLHVSCVCHDIWLQKHKLIP